MTKLSVKVSVDQKAALLEGRVLAASGTIEVAREDLGNHWPDFVRSASINSDGTASATFITVTDLTPAAILAWFEAVAEKQDLEKREGRETLAAGLLKVQSDLDRVRDALQQPMTPAKIQAPAPYQDYQLEGFERQLPYWNDSPGYMLLDNYGTPEQRELIELFRAQYKAMVDTNSAEVGTANSKIIEAAFPELAVKLQAKQEADKQAEIEKKEKMARLYANRLATGYWERETGAYDSKKWSAPWCASVAFGESAKPVYNFGDSTAKWGSSGLLRVPCAPGDIIAHGQKHLRQPSKTEHKILFMRPDGSMEEIDKTEAFVRWTDAKNSPKPATV